MDVTGIFVEPRNTTKVFASDFEFSRIYDFCPHPQTASLIIGTEKISNVSRNPPLHVEKTGSCCDDASADCIICNSIGK